MLVGAAAGAGVVATMVAEGSLECPRSAGGADGRIGMGVEGLVVPGAKARRRETVGDIGVRCLCGDNGFAVFVSLPSELCCEEEVREGCERDDTVIVWACAVMRVGLANQWRSACGRRSRELSGKRPERGQWDSAAPIGPRR